MLHTHPAVGRGGGQPDNVAHAPAHVEGRALPVSGQSSVRAGLDALLRPHTSFKGQASQKMCVMGGKSMKVLDN